MSGSKIAAVLLVAFGAALTLVGLAAGFVPHTLGDLSCGSAFAPAEFAPFECMATLDSSRSLAFMLLVPGVVAVGVGFLVVLATSGKGAFSGMFHQPTVAELEARDTAGA